MLLWYRQGHLAPILVLSNVRSELFEYVAQDGKVCVCEAQPGIFGLIARFARSPEKGAETVVYLATSQQVQGTSGGYYFDCKLTPPSPAAQDDGTAEHLWQVSEQLVGIA